MRKAYLAIDSGGGSTRTALISPEGEILGFNQVNNKFDINYREPDIKCVSFQPGKWLLNILNAAQSLCCQINDCEITAVTASSAREGIVLIDKNGTAFTGLPNSDQRGRLFAEKYQDKSNYIYHKTGKWCESLFSVFKLLGLPLNIYSEVRAFTSISEWIGFELTGELAIERSHACETLLYDPFNDSWSSELCRLFNIDSAILPKVRHAGEILGTLRPETARKLGISHKVPFIITGADTQTAAKSVWSSGSDYILVSGSTSPLVCRLDTPRVDLVPNQRFWLDCDLCEGWLAEVNTGSSGINIMNYCKDIPVKVNLNLNEIDREICSFTSLKYIASMCSKFFRMGRSMSQKGFVNLTGEKNSGSHSHADMIAALRFDIAMSIADNVFLMDELNGFKADYITGCGGGTASSLGCQWIADACGRELIIYEGSEQATTQGCKVICNAAFHEESSQQKISRRYIPNKDSIILNYRKEWESLRAAK